MNLITEEVEPGVYRVLSDGVRELALPVVGDETGQLAAKFESNIVAGHDGSVWLIRPDESFRLGDVSATPRE